MNMDGEDFFQGSQAVDDGYASGDGGGADYGSGENGSVGAQGDQRHMVRPGGALLPFDPRRAPNERDLVMAVTNADGENAIMGYFDQNFMKNWAGPEHWKLRKVVRKRKFLPVIHESCIEVIVQRRQLMPQNPDERRRKLLRSISSRRPRKTSRRPRMKCLQK